MMLHHFDGQAIVLQQRETIRSFRGKGKQCHAGTIKALALYFLHC